MLNETLQKKYEALQENLKQLGKVAIAFSGGVDSTFLLKVAHDVLGENAIAVTIKSGSVPTRELDEAVEICEKENITHFVQHVDQLTIPGFQWNPKDRCYICKKGVFNTIYQIAGEQGIQIVADGTNMDDVSEGVYRPGVKALEELGVVSPLKAAGLTKQDIRDISEELGLSTWNKPSYACLATRFPYGDEITNEKLAQVEQAENALLDMGFTQMRVRVHGTIARLEIPQEDLQKALDLRNEIALKLKELGYDYVTLDLEGFRSGSMDQKK